MDGTVPPMLNDGHIMEWVMGLGIGSGGEFPGF